MCSVVDVCAGGGNDERLDDAIEDKIDPKVDFAEGNGNQEPCLCPGRTNCISRDAVR